MRLTAREVDRFYAIWKPLILYVNRRLRLVPSMLPPDVPEPWDPRDVMKIRDALWADDSLREAFIAENPAGLSEEDLTLVASWQHRRAGTFFILRHLKKYTVFFSEEDSTVYGVLGLISPIDEVVPFIPCYVKAVLLPFGERIIYDSLLVPYNVTFGKGIRASLTQTYNDAKERGAIVTSLLPRATPPGRDEKESAIHATNRSVLDAFRTHLFRAGRSPKVVERDLGSVAAFAEDHLLAGPQPRSLREFGSEDVGEYLSQQGRRKEVRLGLERFVRFLRDTDRMDIDAADYALDILKGRA